MSQPDGQSPTQPADVVARVERLASLAERRWQAIVEADQAAGLDPDEAASPASARGPRERARELRDHARTFLLPRVRDLDAPLLVAIVGPTGAGKSSLINALVGASVSATGVLRPTTRDAVAVGSQADLGRLLDGGALASIPGPRIERHVVTTLPGVVLVDAPDVDSVEHENRAIADRLLEAADLCLFVTTATRYADKVPWNVLERAEERRLPLIVVLNRMPPGEDGWAVLEDARRLVAESGLQARDIFTVPEGAIDGMGSAIDGTGCAIDRDALRPLLAQVAELSADGKARRALAASALEGALAGVAPLVASVADDLEREIREGEALREHARREYDGQVELMLERLFSGTFMREEVIRHWHSFVGADQVTRLFASGIGQVRGAIATVLRGPPRAPVATVQQGATDDIAALVASHADEASRATASHWSADPRGGPLVAVHPELWSSSPGLEPAIRDAVEAWVASIAADVAERGARRRGPARVAALGVNAAAVTLMLVTFSHTGGLTGAEAGIAAATAFLNQKLLNALFGEAAVQEMIRRARQRLRDALVGLLDEERRRFDGLLAEPGSLEALATELRAVPG